MHDPVVANSSPRIGLALSGGGFRASLFHLGVMRRLEELGIMKDIAVVSSVSGGSIIAAYYLVEMERRLRERRQEIQDGTRSLDEVRQELSAEIGRDFCAALAHNLRTRALLFAPFYHPLHFYKSLSPGYSRSDLIQLEYDRWFYGGVTLSTLPIKFQGGDRERLLTGPRLILNTTSLMTGRRVEFSRESISGINELKTVNTNVLKMSRIVGASSCVPGLFPPVSVSGDLLVDGGVSDNQGIEGLVAAKCDVMLVSDASGQMEQVHAMVPRAATVVGRTTSILQFQVRNKLLDLLQVWKAADPSRQFAFIHMFLDLKGRGVPRVPSELIPGIARLRTDLDQFSLFEQEALIYHGYTLIDAQIHEHCAAALTDPKLSNAPQKVPPLFREVAGEPDQIKEGLGKRRERLKELLETGSQKVFLLRSLKRYPRSAGPILALNLIIPVLLLGLYIGKELKHHRWLTDNIGRPILAWVEGFIPSWLRWLFGDYLGFLHWPIDADGITVVVVLLLFFYLLSYSTYVIMRRSVGRLDAAEYCRLAGGQKPTHEWQAWI